MILPVNFIKTAKADTETGGVGQRILCIVKNATGYGAGVYNFPYEMAKLMNMPCDVIYTDLTPRIPNDTFYDAQGNGKYCFIFTNNYGWTLNATEKGYLDEYERKFNITEAGMILGDINYDGRYGIAVEGIQNKVFNINWTQNNIQMEFSSKTSGNYTGARNNTLTSGCTVYAYVGNETQNIPFLWSYKDAYGVTKTACSGYDTSPAWRKDWSYLPTMLALKLSTKNILFNYIMGYDVDDINGAGYGRAWNTTEVQNIIDFYENYSLPFNCPTMDISMTNWNSTGWQSAYELMMTRPDIFQFSDHKDLHTQSLEIGADWKRLNDLGLNPNYWYLVAGGDWVNASVAQYLYENMSVPIIRQTLNVGYGQNCTGWFPLYNKTWAPFGAGLSWNQYDTLSTYNWSADTYSYDYQGFLAKQLEVLRGDLISYSGYSSIGWTHYSSVRNEQPLLKGLKDALFDLNNIKVVPVHSSYAALSSRTFQGSYNITNPIYYNASDTLTFALTTLNKAPDDICGIVLPTMTAKMDNQIFYDAGHDGVKCDGGAFIEFKYEAGKTYTVYLNQEETVNPYITTNNYSSQVWLTNMSYSNSKSTLTINYGIPQVTNLTSKIEVYTGNLSAPRAIVSGTFSFDNSSKIATLTTAASNVIIYWLNNLIYINGVPMNEIASIQGIPISNVWKIEDYLNY
jgi:hypothetical protein